MNNTLTALLIGRAADEDTAEQFVQLSRPCPYVSLYISAGPVVVGVYCLPEDKRWWIELPQEQPELLGLETVTVHFTDAVHAASPWSNGLVRPELDVSPCGSRCDRCPQYTARCSGCPATVHWTGAPPT